MHIEIAEIENRNAYRVRHNGGGGGGGGGGA